MEPNWYGQQFFYDFKNIDIRGPLETGLRPGAREESVSPAVPRPFCYKITKDTQLPQNFGHIPFIKWK